ncbi:MAG: VOC family protein [Cyclobacteriaceae bacterium]|nr:VOC family protein [Cyclobacteriaceae bacterium]
MIDLNKRKSTPGEYSTVCPYLMVRDIKEEVTFLHKVFQAPVKEEEFDEQGALMQAEVVVGEVLIMMGLVGPEWPGHPGMNYVFVDDVDQVYRLALELGANSLMEPGDRHYHLREAGFSDKNDHQWWIAQPVSK